MKPLMILRKAYLCFLTVFLDFHTMEGPIKSLFLSVCLFIHQFSIFLRNVSLIFSDIFCVMVDNWNNQNWQRAKSGPRIVFFQTLCKFCISFFSGNNLKRKQILLLIFHHQSHILANQTTGFFKM